MQQHRGDLWKIAFSNFHFTDTCITIGEIRTVSIIERNDDGWNIDSIVTLVKDADGGIQTLTQDLDAFRWTTGDADQPRRRFGFTFT